MSLLLLLQAFGAGNLAALSVIFHKTVLFLAAHLVPMSIVILTADRWLAVTGTDEALAQNAARYMRWVRPSVMQPSKTLLGLGYAILYM